MVAIHFSQQLNPTAIQALTQSTKGPVAREMLKRGLLVETRAKFNLNGGQSGPRRVDTGRLRASIATTMSLVNGKLLVVVSTNVNYARFVHDGTGIYGPRHRYITPVRRKLLRFKTKTSGGRYVYAKRVAGMRPNHFLRDALVVVRG